MTALTKLLASTPFRLAIVYMLAFLVVTGVVIGYLVWHANQLLTSKAAEDLLVEEASLRSQYRAGGALRLAAAVDALVNAPGSGLYLLLDSQGARLAGNLPGRPEALVDDGQPRVFFYRPPSNAVSARLAIGRALAVPGGLVRTGAAETDLFLHPGSDFQVVDLLVTNFHVPGSTLVAMVAGFMGVGWRAAYTHALDHGYRFLSFGDAMLCERMTPP